MKFLFLLTNFSKTIGSKMIVTKTPFRISIFGGGSDMESFYSKSPGAVLSFSINKYMYISSHRYFESDEIRLKYSKTETVKTVSQIQHPIFRTAFEMLGISQGIEVSSIADIPAGTGMGSSSTFTVGVLHNLFTRKNQFVDKYILAEMASQIEIEKLQEPIGKQDQFAASFGGLNVFRFLSHGAVNVESLNLSRTNFDNFQDHLVLFYTGISRSASDILGDQRKNVNSEGEKFDNLKTMVSFVDQGKKLLIDGELQEFGKLVHQSWELKKSLSTKIANPVIDEAYSKALKLGAWGGKLLGAGGGGFLVFVVPPDKKSNLIQNLGLRHYPFQLEFDGSKVIYYEDEE